VARPPREVFAAQPQVATRRCVLTSVFSQVATPSNEVAKRRSHLTNPCVHLTGAHSEVTCMSGVRGTTASPLTDITSVRTGSAIR
jgi:hypothetical protein